MGKWGRKMVLEKLRISDFVPRALEVYQAPLYLWVLLGHRLLDLCVQFAR